MKAIIFLFVQNPSLCQTTQSNLYEERNEATFEPEFETVSIISYRCLYTLQLRAEWPEGSGSCFNISK